MFIKQEWQLKTSEYLKYEKSSYWEKFRGPQQAIMNGHCMEDSLSQDNSSQMVKKFFWKDFIEILIHTS